jgi:N-carbamoylputrescine amidase
MAQMNRRRFLAVEAAGIVAAVAGTSAVALAEDATTAPIKSPATQPKPEPGGLPSDGNLRVALLQMLPHGTDQTANAAKAEDWCKRAAKAGADIALMPEMWNIGYTAFQGTAEGDKRKWQAQAVETDGPWVSRFAALGGELGMAIAVTYLQEWTGAPRNALTLIDRKGTRVLTYAKVHTCDFANFEAATTPGDGFPVVKLDTRLGPVEIGSMICFDREFPESARLLMLGGAEIILVPNACTLEPLRVTQFQVRALENSMMVAMANYPKPYMNGHSCAFDVAGNHMAEAGEEEQLLFADFNLKAMREYRERSIWGNAFRRPHRYAALAETTDLPVFRRKNAYGEPFDPNAR